MIFATGRHGNSSSPVGAQGPGRCWCILQTSPEHWVDGGSLEDGVNTSQISPSKPKNEDTGTFHDTIPIWRCPPDCDSLLQASQHPTWRKDDGVDLGARKVPGGKLYFRQKWYAMNRFSHTMISIILLMRLFFLVRTINCFKHKLDKQWFVGSIYLVCSLVHMTGCWMLEA